MPRVDIVSPDATGPLVLVIVTLGGDRLGLIPSVAELFAERFIVPVNPLRPVIEIAQVPLEPPLIWMDVGAAPPTKSGGGTTTVTFALWISGPSSPVPLPLTVIL